MRLRMYWLLLIVFNNKKRNSDLVRGLQYLCIIHEPEITMASCPSSADASACRLDSAASFSALQASKVAHHPCYSASAHHQYARMHLPVAPACNLQCNYCNRKYDCSNESRPGVVSQLLTPEQAVARAIAVADMMPQLSVVGIAGPGDPLANISRTFTTLNLVRQALPDMKLCLSTNGLMLPAVTDRIIDSGVDHVTVTVNTIDPAIAARIYAWLWLDGERYSGIEAGRILLARQQEGIRRLSEKGVLVKVNSVLIPGINDAHLGDVSAAVRQWGALLHNVMPLISRPEHGTVFGLNGQPEPDAEMVADVRAQCSVSMPQMMHCKQCRADAVGMLGEDRSQRLPLTPSTPALPGYAHVHRRAKLQARIATRGASDAYPACLVAVASTQGDVIDNHFGHAERLQIYSLSSAGIVLVNERFMPRYCTGSDECDPDDGAQSRMDNILDLLSDVEAIFCARMGYAPWQQLERHGITPCVEGAWQNVQDVLGRWWRQREHQATPDLGGEQGVA